MPTCQTATQRRSLEGRPVSLLLSDGSRLEEALLVLSDRGRTSTLWLEVHGVDRFVRTDEVAEMFERRAA